MASSTPPREIELKLLVHHEARAALQAHPLFAPVEPQQDRQITTYFDAPDYALGRAGISLRLRRSDSGKTIQTLKMPGGSASFGERSEWECAAKGELPDLELFEDLDLRPKIRRSISVKLQPVFTITVTRTKWQILLDGATEVEAVLDEGEINAGGKTEPIHEVELELKSGPVPPLCRLGLDLLTKAALSWGAESKAERGYRLLLGEGRQPVHWKNEELDRDTSVEQGLRRIIAAGLNHLVLNMPAAEAGFDEGVHQMRIALRRLRSALVLFRPLIDGLTADRFNDVLRDLGAILGAARDWDVFVGETLCLAEEGGVAVSNLLPSAQRQRDRAHKNVSIMLLSPALTELIIGIAGWSEEQPCFKPDKPPKQTSNAILADMAPDLLDRLALRVFNRGRKIETLTPEARHALRKSAKKLRYGIDALSGLYKPKRVEAYIDHLKRLQDSLGAINDIATTPKMLRNCLGQSDSASSETATALLDWNKKRHHEVLRHLSDHWEIFLDAKHFWR